MFKKVRGKDKRPRKKRGSLLPYLVPAGAIAGASSMFLLTNPAHATKTAILRQIQEEAIKEEAQLLKKLEKNKEKLTQYTNKNPNYIYSLEKEKDSALEEINSKGKSEISEIQNNSNLTDTEINRKIKSINTKTYNEIKKIENFYNKKINNYNNTATSIASLNEDIQALKAKNNKNIERLRKVSPKRFYAILKNASRKNREIFNIKGNEVVLRTNVKTPLLGGRNLVTVTPKTFLKNLRRSRLLLIGGGAVLGAQSSLGVNTLLAKNKQDDDL